jgi:branched-chain amino acid transport system ATP-binding protein
MLLCVDRICVEYHKVPAVRGLSFEVQAGEIVCLVGPNGAGKSTAALTIAGILAPSSGSVTFDETRINGIKAEDVARLGISLVPEGRRIFGRMTVLENLLVPTGMKRGTGSLRPVVERVFAMFPVLAEYQNRLAGALSGGQQQQLAIGRAMLAQPRLMIVDEPSLGLAPQFVDVVFSTFDTLRREGVTLLLIEQGSRRALAIADRIYLIRSGRAVMEGTPAELTNNHAFEAAYFGEAQAS